MNKTVLGFLGPIASAFPILATQAVASQAKLAITVPAPKGTPVEWKKESIESIVRDYLLENPDIVAQALIKVEEAERQRRVTALRPHLEKPFAGAWAGNPDADVVVVEFFDYACGFCRRSVPEVKRLLAEDVRVKVVFREFPILGKGSIEAARASLVAAQAGQYARYQDILFSAAQLDSKTLREAVSLVKLPKNFDLIDGEIKRNRELAEAIGISGTPAFIINGQLITGAVSYDKLKELVAAARQRANEAKLEVDGSDEHGNP